MLDDPSNGSKQTMYLPRLSSSTSITELFSSETNKQVVYDDCSILINNSFDKISSFLTSSPWTFVSPDMPCLLQHKKKRTIKCLKIWILINSYNWAIPAFRTAELTALIAVWMQFNSCDKSPLASGCFFCSASTNRVRVIALASKVWPWLVIVVSFACEYFVFFFKIELEDEN